MGDSHNDKGAGELLLARLATANQVGAVLHYLLGLLCLVGLVSVLRSGMSGADVSLPSGFPEGPVGLAILFAWLATACGFVFFHATMMLLVARNCRRMKSYNTTYVMSIANIIMFPIGSILAVRGLSVLGNPAVKDLFSVISQPVPGPSKSAPPHQSEREHQSEP
jgi:hypothetical protein